MCVEDVVVTRYAPSVQSMSVSTRILLSRNPIFGYSNNQRYAFPFPSRNPTDNTMKDIHGPKVRYSAVTGRGDSTAVRFVARSVAWSAEASTRLARATFAQR